MEVDGQSEGKRLVEVKVAGIPQNGSGLDPHLKGGRHSP